MAWRWCRFDDLGVDALYDVLALRCRVFIVEQAAYQDPDGLDRHAWHLQRRRHHVIVCHNLVSWLLLQGEAADAVAVGIGQPLAVL